MSALSRRLEKEKVREHKCKESMIVHHWFGESSSDAISDLSGGEGDDWDIVNREGRNQDRRRRTKERKERKTQEVAGKARKMVGLGPITDAEIEHHMKTTKDYSKAKNWAVKEHLAKNYMYNQQELDELQILETKRTNRDDVVYIAVRDERDIKGHIPKKGRMQE